ncbi:peptidase C12 family protein [Dictyostelium discoideum AX4]|uniref:Ubiquitin carboxyl-terminal hydrolase isozyme L5 n=1 Tax=Dictyostelium discoideum TaxID=44689 RepID=UCHL5_DICDI|nr:peptidase C12 family protein [Dictyostelium discoideum AX4]Q54N38.1 RecName: Full=Ubiquitin carboxyl-terminal hydrolase isozyme L5; Short=UCH-L5; AltName: Full=Ubiquitin thioesterase L5 [Dictyostelium discoideum]EAL64601.1 peptidase C12 family protein [Dictyostelium discoideum AX4]|eukprot:XP_638105.1 peptidase C12 family protein [Dictyostelium discoideum AX4]
MSENEGWCTIESDPGVFTELITKIGVKDIQVEELYTLDSSEYDRLKPVLGLIFLFKWEKEEENRTISDNENIFFANQVIQNACATQAILSVLLNSEGIELGEELSNFKSFVGDFPPMMKGEAIGNSELIKETHNSFTVQDPFIFSKKKNRKPSDAFHFISFIPFQGKVYELDGLKKGPYCLGDCTPDNWLEIATPFIQKRMEKYSQGEIRFNLMAVIKNRQTTLQEKILTLEKKKNDLEIKLSELNSGSGGDNKEESGGATPTTKEDLNFMINVVNNDIEEANNEILMEQEKFRNWKDENIRRKHNFTPLILNLIKGLAEKDNLQPLIQKAKDQISQKQQQHK